MSRLRRDCHACGSKTAISRLLTPVLPFLTPGGKVWAITALTDSFWQKIFKYLNKLEPVRENNDRTFAKSRILVRKEWRHGHTSHTRRDELRITLNDQSIDLLAINQKVFGTSSEIVGHLRKLTDIFGYYRSRTKNLDTLRIKMSRLWITKSWQV